MPSDAIGIPSIYGGAHTNQITEMALVSLPDGSYLELMGVQSDGSARVDRHEWGKFLKGNAGPCAWAVREKDIAAEVKRLQAAGISVAAPVKSGRERPDGVRLEWDYTWMDILQHQNNSDLQDINLILNTGFRF